MISQDIPVVELHRHLDGNIRPATIWQLADKFGVKLPASSLEELVKLTQIQDKTSDLLSFLQKLDYGVSVLGDTQACWQVAYENVQDAANEKIDYIELRFSPYYMAMAFKLPVAEVVEAVIDGVRAGQRDFGVSANLIGILSRTFGVQACLTELNGLLAHRQGIVALDLAGDELGYPAPLFREHFTKGRDAGWQITVHAGEADGPQSIWNAIELLGATRIGHGVAAQHDQRLLDYLAENNIGIESCPTSNYQTATVVDIANHPLKQFLAHGVAVTLSTDDPGVSAITLADEYRVAAEVIGLSNEQLRKVQQNGLQQAFLSTSEKQRLINERR